MGGKSRPQRWQEAVAEGQAAHEELQGLLEDVQEAISEAWQDALVTIQQAIDNANESLSGANQKAVNALAELNGIKEEYQEWYDNLPDNLRYSATAERLEEVINLEFDESLEFLIDSYEGEEPAVELDLSELESQLSEAEGAELPRGFGKD